MRAPPPALAAVLAAALVAGLWSAHRVGADLVPLEQLELLSLDLRFVARGAIPPGTEVVIVAFDDDTLATAPDLFRTRAGWASVLAAVAAHRPRAIGVDAFFSEPEDVLPPDLAADVRAFVADPAGHPPEDRAAALLARVARLTEGDAELARAIREAGNVVLAMHPASSGAGTSPGPAPAKARYGQSTGSAPARETGFKLSLPALLAQARSAGDVTIHPDASSRTRELRLGYSDGEGVVAPFAVQLAALHLGVPRAQLAFLGDGVRLGDRTVLTGGGAGLWLNFRGGRGAFPRVPARDVAAGRVAPDSLRDRIVLVGIDYFGHDLVRTPFGDIPGVELHAAAIDNLLRGDPLRRARWPVDAAAALGAGLLVALAFVQRLRLRAASQALASGAIVLGAAFAVHAAFSSSGLWISLVAPVGASLAASVAGLAASYAGEGRARRQLRKAFVHYLGDDAVAELLADPRALRLGGERRHASVLFADVRGFTTIAEGLTPLETIAYLNAILAPMTHAVLAERGYLDKYVGDAVMAVFGAPVVTEDHTERALACALAMHRELAEVSRTLPALGMGFGVSLGVGVNTGHVVAGNIGSDERFDYTVVGDTVNLASRIEGLTRMYGVFCLVGEATRRAAGAAFRFREVDRVEVKGRKEPEPIHELLAGPGATIATYARLDAWDVGLVAWRAGELGAARAAFAAFSEANPDDRAARIYLDELARLPDRAPEGWRAVRVYAAK